MNNLLDECIIINEILYKQLFIYSLSPKLIILSKVPITT